MTMAAESGSVESPSRTPSLSSIPAAGHYPSNWTEAIMEHPVFAHLAEQCCNGNDERVAVCQTRGDLFVWDPKCQILLTANIKRLHGNISTLEEPSESPFCFQFLHPIILPATPPNSLLPSPLNTQYLALVGDHYLYIIELWRQRGPYGEFSGGVAEVDCRTIPIGDTLIRAHRLLVLQAEWHPEDSTVIGALFNDGGLRLFRLSNPAMPFLTLIVSNPHSTFSQLLRLDQSGIVISFSFASNNIILLQDTMDIQTIPVKEGEQPSVPLPMYPLDKDNYSDTACGMLVMQTHPPIIVMATTSGRLLHCVLLEFQDDENGIASEDGSITVVENIELGINGEFIRFLYDPLMKYSYYVVTSSEIYSMELPWISNLEQYGFDGVQFSTNPPSVDKVLHYSSEHCICDGTIVSDPILGLCILATSTTGSCIPITINKQFATLYQSSFLNQLPAEAETQPTVNPFVMHICELLDKPKEKYQIQLKPGDNGNSQKECFQFLQESLMNIRKIYIAPQQTAAVKLIGRIQSLAKRRERHIGQVLAMEEDCDSIREAANDLELKIEHIRERHTDQNNRIENILATITKSSPVLSDAERMLAKDLMVFQEQMEPLKFALSQAREKVKLGLSKTKNTQLKLNAEKLDTILTSLTKDGTAIQNNIKTIKRLAESVNVDVMQRDQD